MKQRIIPVLAIFVLLQITLHATPKKVIVANASDTTLRVCVYTSSTVDDIGSAVGEFKELSPGDSHNYEYKFINGMFIHTIVFLDDQDKIIIDTKQINASDNKEITINITKPLRLPVDRPEVDRMRRLVENEIENFSHTYKYKIKVDGDANLGIQEYLGAVAIIDTSQRDYRSSIKLIYYGRQLEISENPPLSGRSFQENYRITKQYSGDAAVNIPSAFSSNIDFTNGDLQEITLSCKSIGTVLLPTRPGVTPIGVLLDFDDKSSENIVGTIAKTLNDCSTCILQQIQGILAHSGIAVNVKRFKKSNIAISGSAANVVTANGIYSYENGYDYFDIISPRVIALGFSDINLKTNFSQSVLEKLKNQKRDVEKLINNQQVAMSSLQTQLAELNELIITLESF